MGEIKVVMADPARDAQPIAQLIGICRQERRTVLDAYSTEEERTYLEQLKPPDAVFVAYIGDSFAGFAGIARRWPYSQRLHHCGEGGTWVMPEFRRTGVGRALWHNGIIPWCKRVGFHHVGFFVMAHNKDAITFYKRLGFRVCGNHRRLIRWEQEYLDAVEMEKWMK
jgi:GNAT superfamily N-acetyltransferase